MLVGNVIDVRLVLTALPVKSIIEMGTTKIIHFLILDPFVKNVIKIFLKRKLSVVLTNLGFKSKLVIEYISE